MRIVLAPLCLNRDHDVFGVAFRLPPGRIEGHSGVSCLLLGLAAANLVDEDMIGQPSFLDIVLGELRRFALPSMSALLTSPKPASSGF